MFPVYFSSITDDTLDTVVRDIKSRHPAAGETMLKGHINAKGIYVTRKRLRASIHRVDPDGVDARRLATIKRRRYSVPSPNYIWHIDGTHKLIRWKFVCHAGIDGFSRTIVYCQCNDNNRSATVLNKFREAVNKYGVPLHVRSDFGGENVGVWQEISNHHKNDKAVILGSSVHNQRIERLNRDINLQVINNFSNIFSDLESQNLLDPLNETDLFCLHFVYLKIINNALKEFTSAWNNHAISSENNLSPLQLFHMNLQLRQLHSLPTLNNFDLNQPANQLIEIEPINSPLDVEQLQVLAEELLQYDNDMNGISQYKKAIEFVGICLANSDLA